MEAKNGFVGAIEKFYRHRKYNAYKSLYESLTIPIFAFCEGKVVFANSKFYQHFRNDPSIAEALMKQSAVTYSNVVYSKQRIFSQDSLEVFQVINRNIFSTPQNVIPNALLDVEGNVIKGNAIFFKLLEKTRLEGGKSFTQYVDEKSQELILQFFENKQKPKEPVLEVKFKGKDAITTLMYLLKVPNGNLYNCYLIDITEFKNVEMNFIHSQKMQAIGQLSGGIAHDFNNLLTAMLGFCDLLLLKHPAGDPSFAEIMQIKQNANRAANLVRQLLALSRKQVLKPKILDITDTIAELTNLIRRLIGEEIKLKLNYADDLEPVKVDQGQLEQVIINLVVNAKDAILANGNPGVITVSTKNVNVRSGDKEYTNLSSAMPNEKIAPGRYVLIEVSDNGIGMDQKTKSKIFEPFFSTKEIGAGTGLGLSTVYGIINQLGGYIYVDSQEGEGSKFSVYLKSINLNQECKEDENMDEMDNKLVHRDVTGDATILLVEDEAPVRMFSSHALSNKGYKVIEAGGAEEALTIMRERGKSVDIIITDVIMPGMNGPSLILEIQKNYPNLKVIFISGYAEEAFSDEYALEEDQEFNFLSKPFTLQQLVNKVKDVLDMKVKS